jgi:methyl-accepting chemotaxis protein
MCPICIPDLDSLTFYRRYEGTIKLAGIIYLHRISDNRMAGTPLRNLRMFGRLCGDDAIGNVILVTTMWGNTKEDVGARREQELKDKYWKGMLTLGSRMARFLNSTKSAWDIVGLIVTKGHTNPLLLQEELVDLRKRLSETQAAIVLYQDLQRYLEEQKETIKKLQQGVVNQDDEQVLRELTQQVKEIQTNLRNTLDQIQELKIPLGRRLASFFFSKKSRAVSSSHTSAGCFINSLPETDSFQVIPWYIYGTLYRRTYSQSHLTFSHMKSFVNKSMPSS